MSMQIDRRILAAALAALAWCSSAPNPAIAQDRPAEAILADIDAIKPPTPPASRGNAEAMKAFADAQRRTMDERSDRIAELYKAHPDRPELVKLLPLKWRTGQAVPARTAANLAEVDAILAAPERGKLFAEAAYFRFIVAFGKAGQNPKYEQIMPAIEEFIGRVPADPRCASLLSMAADRAEDPAKKAEFLARIEKDYPDSSTARYMAGERRQAAGLGKPFNLEFDEAIGGSRLNMKDLKGKVVVIDFWATWCGPCVAEMPTMKKLYAEYKPQGVEFIGVSLDTPVEQGGLAKLKDYAAKNGIAWPQYYQGNGWESEFSMSWGVNSIPCVFLVDADGNLASTQARGELEKLIPEYLKKAKAAGTDR